MSPRFRAGVYGGGILLLVLCIYALSLRLRLSGAREQNEALVKERDALQALLAEQDADGALQKRLQEQLRKLANDRLAKEKEQLEARQRAELQEARQEHEKSSRH